MTATMPRRIVILGAAGRDFNSFDRPVVRARSDFADAGEPTLGSVVDAFLAGLERKLGSA